MRLRLKIVYLFTWYLFKVKKKLKMGYYENEDLNFAGHLGVIFFRHTTLDD